MTPPRVEPLEELRDRDGWHWLETQVPADPPYIAQLPWFWATTNQTWRYGETMERTPDELAQVGWRYASPCLTPAEVAALRAERDAAALLADKLQPFADAYEANKFSSCLADMMMSVAPQHWSEAAAALAAYRAASPRLKP